MPARRPPHPGARLRLQLEHVGVTQTEFAEWIGISRRCLAYFLAGERDLHADMAWRIAGALKQKPETWMRYKSQYELARDKPAKRIRPL